MNEMKIDANDVINALLEQISTQSKDIAMLKVQIGHLMKEADDGGDTVQADNVHE